MDFHIDFNQSDSDNDNPEIDYSSVVDDDEENALSLFSNSVNNYDSNQSYDEESPNDEQNLPVNNVNEQQNQIIQRYHDLPNGLRPVYEIPEKYRSVFSDYPCFNSIQSKVLDDLLYSDKPVVVAAPTGAGKTVLFELAIIRLLQQMETVYNCGDYKIIYIAPVKALCSERFFDWKQKFEQFGVRCLEVTGDSEPGDYFQLRGFRLIFTTPEKWDSITRKWRDNKSLLHCIKLFLIDEVHILSDEQRGPIIEAIVSRMKTVQQSINIESGNSIIRYIAVSATIPNIEDIATWLSNKNTSAIPHKFSDEERPVKLDKVVLGYHCDSSWSSFKFDLSLTYKLNLIIKKYSSGRPSLVFCSTRKSVQLTMSVLSKESRYNFTSEQREQLLTNSRMISDNKIKEHVLCGIGCHHAGMSVNDRRIIEDLFRSSSLPVLIATSTLAMGVNLPAHLVIIKSTEQYVGGMYVEYPESTILQMMGRAGRPQYDDTAVAVIMTKDSQKLKYEKFIGGLRKIESSLHRHLAEHLNAEIVLHTITNTNIALEWIKSTYLYVRAIKSPKEYGVSGTNSKQIEQKLHDLCLRELNALSSNELIEMQGLNVIATDMGRLMARYYMKFDSMKIFMQLTGDENICSLLTSLSKCAEFNDIQLRMNERRNLNLLNTNKEGIRFRLAGKIKTKEMKVNVLIQAALGCLAVYDPGLHQESVKIIRIAQRVIKCMNEFLLIKRKEKYLGIYNSILLSKAVYARMWHDSTHVARQLERIGPALATQLAAAGKTTFDTLMESNPRDLERILNRGPPLGNNLQTAISKLPKYKLNLNAYRYNDSCIKVSLELKLENSKNLELGSTTGDRHSVILLLADKLSNKLFHHERITDSYLIENNSYEFDAEIKIDKDTSAEIIVNIISETWVGIDVKQIVKLDGKSVKVNTNNNESGDIKDTDDRIHATTSKSLKLELQKFVVKKANKKKLAAEATNTQNEYVEPKNTSICDKILEKYKTLPVTPALTRIARAKEVNNYNKYEEINFNDEPPPPPLTRKRKYIINYSPNYPPPEEISFDIGAEELLESFFGDNSNNTTCCEILQFKKPRIEQKTPERKIRHLSPPKNKNELNNLVSIVLGPSVTTDFSWFGNEFTEQINSETEKIEENQPPIENLRSSPEITENASMKNIIKKINFKSTPEIIEISPVIEYVTPVKTSNFNTPSPKNQNMFNFTENSNFNVSEVFNFSESPKIEIINKSSDNILDEFISDGKSPEIIKKTDENKWDTLHKELSEERSRWLKTPSPPPVPPAPKYIPISMKFPSYKK